jgi:hypothetical protein
MAENTQHQVGDSTVELVGTKMEFLEAPADKYPLGLRVEFVQHGALVPFRTGFMEPGSAPRSCPAA